MILYRSLLLRLLLPFTHATSAAGHHSTRGDSPAFVSLSGLAIFSRSYTLSVDPATMTY